MKMGKDKSERGGKWGRDTKEVVPVGEDRLA